jgi:methyl-accepting chemotaxis protein
MAGSTTGSRRHDRIDISYDYEVCAWARHFNTTQERIKDAVKAVGSRADRVRDHLAATAAGTPRASSERPSGS